MKRKALIISLLLCMVFLSCKRLNPFQSEKLTVSIDGDKSKWGENQIGVTKVADGILIECIKTSGLNVEQLTIGIGLYGGVGSYTFDENFTGGNSASYVKTGLTSDITAIVQSGFVDITDESADGVEGTFEFIMVDADSNFVEFTAGKFKANYLE